MIALLLSVAFAADLPPRPELGSVAATECPETDVIAGAVTLPAGGSGSVLPVAVYLHLEEHI